MDKINCNKYKKKYIIIYIIYIIIYIIYIILIKINGKFYKIYTERMILLKCLKNMKYSKILSKI